MMRSRSAVLTADPTSSHVSIDKAELRQLRSEALIARVQKTELAEIAGSFGIAAAIIGLVWMLGRCGPTLLPWIFQ